MRVDAPPVGRRRRFRAPLTMMLALVLCCSSACAGQVDGSAAPVSVSGSAVTVTVTATVTVVKSEPESVESSAVESISRQTNPDPCVLLVLSEATALAGMELQAGIGSGPENGVNTVCTYTRDPYAGGTAQVSVIVGDGAKKTLDIDKDVLKHEFAQLPGIADEVWQEDGSVFVRKGTVWVTVALVLLNDHAANVKPMQQAAKIVASRF